MIGDLLQKFKSADFFQKIIFLNIITYLFYFISSVIGYNSQILSFFSVEKNFLSNPWSIFTYAFLHQNIFDLIFMMFLLKFSSELSVKSIPETSAPNAPDNNFTSISIFSVYQIILNFLN